MATSVLYGLETGAMRALSRYLADETREVRADAAHPAPVPVFARRFDRQGKVHRYCISDTEPSRGRRRTRGVWLPVIIWGGVAIALWWVAYLLWYWFDWPTK